MDIFDNLTKAAKDFFVEPEDPATSPARPAPARSLPSTPAAPAFAAGPGGAYAPPAATVTQPEQRHLDHIQGLLAGDGKDFVAYTKMVKSMATSGLSGPVLYQTAYNAFAAITGLSLPALLASADGFANTLADDHQKVLARHREKTGEAPNTKEPAGPLVQAQQQEQQLQADLAALQRQLEEKQQALLALQQQLHQERQKAHNALASYELAHAAAAAELQAHRQATQSFLAAQ